MRSAYNGMCIHLNTPGGFTSLCPFIEMNEMEDIQVSANEPLMFILRSFSSLLVLAAGDHGFMWPED